MQARSVTHTQTSRLQLASLANPLLSLGLGCVLLFLSAGIAAAPVSPDANEPPLTTGPAPFYAQPQVKISHDVILPVWQNVAIIEREYNNYLSRPIPGMQSLSDFAHFSGQAVEERNEITANDPSQIVLVVPDNNPDSLLPVTPAISPPTLAEEPNNLWVRIRSGFQLTGHDNPRVKQHLDWYARHQDYLNRVVTRAQPFLYDIVQEVARLKMPMEVALLPVVESAFQPFAYSPGRAAGIWQFIPATGRRYGLKQNWWYDGRRDVPASTRAALRYLSELNKRFDGDWHLALAAYNSGEGRVQRAIRKNLALGKKVDFWSLDLPSETREYVPKLLAISAIVNSTQDYNINLIPVADEPFLTQVDIGSQIDLALAADLAGMPIESLYALNPAFNRWATDPDGPHTLSLPLEIAESFQQALAATDARKRVQWHRHTIKQGETLGHIARKYQTTVKLLQQVNNIEDKWIRAGQGIIIPVATKDLRQYLSEDQRRLAIQHKPRDGHKTVHTVLKGDTLWDLSLEYDVTVSQITAWNNMSPRDMLKLGQKLVIWTSQAPAAVTSFTSLPGNHKQQRLQYRVRKGDSLARIAKKFRVTVSNLRNWNSLQKDKYLQPGQMLTLYVDITRQS